MTAVVRVLEIAVDEGDGHVQRLHVEAEKGILLGSGAHCELQLPRDAAAFEHVELRLDETGIYARALASEPPVLVGGSALVHGPIADGATLAIGPTQITLRVVKRQKPRAGLSPLWAAALAPVLALGVYVSLASASGGWEPVIPEAPALFGARVEVCGLSDPEQAMAFAADRYRVARAKEERRPFAIDDAVQAVALYEAAAGCFRRAGADDAPPAAEEAASLRRSLEEEYRTRRLRLEHAYRIGDVAGVRREASALWPMVQHLQGPYIEWLASARRIADEATDRVQRERRALY